MIKIESKEISVITPRKMNTVEFRLVSAFVEMAKILSSMPKKLSYEEIKKYRDDLKPYEKFPFSRDVLRVIDREIEKASSIIVSREKINPEYIKSSIKTFDDVIGSFLKGDYKSVNSRSSEVHDIHTSFMKSTQNENDLEFDNPMYTSTNFLNMGQGDRLLTTFQSDSLKKIADLDLSKFIYTGMDLPKSKLSDTDYIIYFIRNLKDSPKPFRADIHDVMRATKVSLGDNEAYEKLVKLVSEYLHNNKKDLIPEILELLPKAGSLYKSNESAKKKIKRVYRGVPDADEVSTKEAIAEDKKRKFVATGKSRDVAFRFATRTGWIMRNKESESPGIVIEYGVDYDSIILDTEIFGSVFGESEVLIDASKAKVISADVEYPRGYGDEEEEYTDSEDEGYSDPEYTDE